jgi:hypothetical protein
LLAAGALVFFWESPGGTVLALGLLALGAYLLLKPGGSGRTGAVSAKGDEAFRVLVRWRNRRAAEAGVVNTAVLSDAELGCIAALDDPTDVAAVAGCLEKGGAERAAEIARVLEALRA